MKEQDKKMVLPKLDDLFTIQEQRDNPVVDEVKEIELYKIGEFPDHPFRVLDDDKMEEMVKSVKEYGVLLPVIVRKRGEGNYQMISGHRRKRACELAGIDKIKCIVKDLTDDEATILMVDSNIQREEILPSEKAFAYKMKLEAMKHQGKRVDLEENETSTPVVAKLRTDEILGNEVGESRENIRRYIRLTYLIPELLEQVDKKRIAFRPAVELSYLSEENQYVVENIFEFDEVTPSLSQAIRLKKLEQEGNLTEEKIEEILQQEKPNQKEYIKIHNEKIEKYIPSRVKESGNVEDFIISLVLLIKFITIYLLPSIKVVSIFIPSGAFIDIRFLSVGVLSLSLFLLLSITKVITNEAIINPTIIINKFLFFIINPNLLYMCYFHNNNCYMYLNQLHILLDKYFLWFYMNSIFCLQHYNNLLCNYNHIYYNL